MKRVRVIVNSLWTWDLLGSLFGLEINVGEVGLHEGTLLLSSGADNSGESRKEAL